MVRLVNLKPLSLKIFNLYLPVILEPKNNDFFFSHYLTHFFWGVGVGGFPRANSFTVMQLSFSVDVFSLTGVLIRLALCLQSLKTINSKAQAENSL